MPQCYYCFALLLLLLLPCRTAVIAVIAHAITAITAAVPIIIASVVKKDLTILDLIEEIAEVINNIDAKAISDIFTKKFLLQNKIRD